MVSREASHAGSWYSSNPTILSRQLSEWLSQVPTNIKDIGKIPKKGARVIIAPHAGYAYSGPAAAWAYKSLDLSKAKRIFLLGPSHHAHLSNCALSKCTTYDTPLGPLPLDKTTNNTLLSTGKFSQMSQSVDEAEHSLEMHLPYIYKRLTDSFPNANPTTLPPLIPILVGSTSSTTERTYGKLLAPYLSDPTSIFIISSDFCHWGLRFNYTYYLPSSAITTSSATSRSSTSTTNTTSTPNIPTGYNLPSKSSPPSNPPIHESISQLDNLCIRAIESGKYTNFNHVIRETGNTVCGRHPIGIILAALEVLEQEAASGDEVNEEDADGKEDENEETIDDEKGIRKEKGKFQFIHYSRSSDCVKIGDSSVSYASAFAIL